MKDGPCASTPGLAAEPRCPFRCPLTALPGGGHDRPTTRPAHGRPKTARDLVCPLTKGPLEYDAEKQELISRSAKLAYPIRDGIPIMLPEEARPIE
jgi:hypothetical protein